MNDAVTQTEQEMAMMTVVADIVEGGRALIRDWPLRANAEQALRDGGPAGLARYYHDCIDRPSVRAAWIKATPSPRQEDPEVRIPTIHGDLP